MAARAAPPAAFAETALLVRSFQVARMLHVAVELRLADRLDGGPRPAEELAADCGADPAMLLRLCRALAAFGVFTVDGDGRVGQNDRSAWLREAARPTLYHATRYWGMPRTWATWGDLEHTVRTGEPAFEALFGMPHFEHLKAHPEEAERFDRFMQHSPDDRHAAVAEAYDFSDATLVVDVGGGTGGLLAAILTAFPKLRGVLFDQPAVVEGAAAALGAVADRCTVRCGDFFREVPPGGDVYALAQILHDWSDERCATILGNCRRAMRRGARLLVIERLLGPAAGTGAAMDYLADMHMMVLFPGARERTVEEYERLLRAGGFEAMRLIATRSPFQVLEVRAA